MLRFSVEFTGCRAFAFDVKNMIGNESGSSAIEILVVFA